MQNDLFFNPKHNILTPKNTWMMDSNYQLEWKGKTEVTWGGRVQSRVSARATSVKEWDTPSDVGHKDGEFDHNHSVNTLLHVKKKKKPLDGH